MNALKILFGGLLLSLLAACGGGGSTSDQPQSPGTPSGATTVVLGGAGKQTFAGVSLLRLSGTYVAHGSVNVIGLMPSTCSDPKPSIWGLPCESGQVKVQQTTAGWLEEHKLPAHVAQHNAQLEMDGNGAVVVDHEGCTYSSGGSKAVLTKHPEVVGQQFSLERTCPQVGTRLYSVQVTQTSSGDSTNGQLTTVYTLIDGGVKAMTLNFYIGLEAGRLLSNKVTYAHFDQSGAYTKVLDYNVMSY
jgi:hypothetical protein